MPYGMERLCQYSFRRDKSSDNPSATIELHRVMVQTRIRTLATRSEADFIAITPPWHIGAIQNIVFSQKLL